MLTVIVRSTLGFSAQGPPTYPILGCLISFYKNRYRLLAWYTDLLEKSATGTIVIRRLGARRTIVTANPENLEYILKTNFNNFPKGQPFTEILGDFLGCGIFNVDGDLWRMQRKLASHEFSTKSLREFFTSTLNKEVGKKLMPLLDRMAKGETEIDLQDLLRRLAFNVICKLSLGVERWSLDPSEPISPLAKAFDVASEVCAKRGATTVSVVWKIKRWLGVGSEKRLKEAIQQLHEYVEEMIYKKKKKIHESQNEDLLSRLILAGHENKVIRDMVISFIMAGRDTTSAAMTWLFWLLSCNPEIEQELIKETESVNKQHLSHEKLKELRLLKACLCESMRLYPPVAWDSKHAMFNDFLPDGTQVNAGDRVTYFPYGMGRMESLWGKDRLDFRPERWSIKGEKVTPFKFPVFQAGPRTCLGKEIAFIQMKYVMASLLQRFEIRPVSSSPPVYVPYLTAYMAGGFKVLVHKRSQLKQEKKGGKKPLL
ncbi:hypothetical protein ACFE04_010320 [Oxalis oulophora]